MMVDPNTRDARTGKITVENFLEAVDLAAPPVLASSPVQESEALPTNNLMSFWPLQETGGPRYDVFSESALLERYVNSAEAGAPAIPRVGFGTSGYAADFGGTPTEMLAGPLPGMETQQLAFAFRFKFPTLPIPGLKYPILTLANPNMTGSFLAIGIEQVDESGTWLITVYAGRLDVGVERFQTSFPVTAGAISHLLVYSTAYESGSWGDLVVVRDGVKETFTRGVPFVTSSPTLHVGGNPTPFGHPGGLPFDVHVMGISYWNGAAFSDQNIADIYNGGRGYTPDSPLLNGLEAYWPLNETATGATRRDRVSGYYDLRNPDNSVGGAVAKVGNGAVFTNGDEVYLIGNARPYSPTGAFTLTCWVKFATFVATDQVIWTNLLAGATHRGIRLLLVPDEPIALEIGDGTASIKKLNALELPLEDTWYFICAGINAAAEMFISINNGTRAVGAGGFPSDSIMSMIMGKDPGGLKALNGTVDEMALYRRAVSLGEQAALYNNGAGLAWPF